MPFDPNLDKKLFSEEKEFERTKVSVSVMSYNDGPKKLQISRENKTAAGEMQFAKLGRMTKEEAEVVLPMMQKAIEQM
ncbi:hypothetical protein HN695_03130 [Candidatus Woesearchaeota archaeon]|jgi:hypothetical protein|nr:hypothetical protein [Candidatus Woesearchaeota archaeon]MBT5271769.1 hypothetical protein [Candidatus Woesearchaeota archaeon]MBT6041190.1 hypothetical protein [Candidatus Woesearchaeota archaeon]MBT6336311.1 hypothetical protein [Candidatus Woesearchaeota archaeon]MBT7927303.1 hypothetical protein [Candidatus Woesearchaeota archaeon]